MIIKTYTPTGRPKNTKEYEFKNHGGLDGRYCLTLEEAGYEDDDDKSKEILVLIDREEFERMKLFFK